MTSIFEGQPPKTRPTFQSKQGSFGFKVVRITPILTYKLSHEVRPFERNCPTTRALGDNKQPRTKENHGNLHPCLETVKGSPYLQAYDKILYIFDLSATCLSNKMMGPSKMIPIPEVPWGTMVHPPKVAIF